MMGSLINYTNLYLGNRSSLFNEICWSIHIYTMYCLQSKEFWSWFTHVWPVENHSLFSWKPFFNLLAIQRI